jgi:ATP-dependent DNA helicase RecG
MPNARTSSGFDAEQALFPAETLDFIRETQPKTWGEFEILHGAEIGPFLAGDITRLLQGLVTKGALVQEGQARWTRYRLSEDIHSVHTDASSLHNGIGSLHNGIGSLHNGLGSLHNGVGSLHSPELLAVAAPARQQKRLPPSEMEQVLLQLCRGRWLTRHELSVLVNRNSESLRQRFLNPMVEHGLLQLRYPDKPNRADQAYTVADSTTELSD